MNTETGKILVVDDDADMRGLLSDVLESDGYRVGTAESGEKALQALAEEQYDLVLPSSARSSIATLKPASF